MAGINWRVAFCETLESTQDYLKAKISNGDSVGEGDCVIARKQTRGHGRHGRRWAQAEGNIYMSFCLQPSIPVSSVGQIPIMLAVALSHAIDKICAHHLSTVKWPNDLYIGDKKCAGMLVDVIDSSHDDITNLVVGIGVNLKSAPLPRATALQTHCRDEIRYDIAVETLHAMISYYYRHWQDHGFNDIRRLWLQKRHAISAPISVKIGDNIVTGRFHDIDHDGALHLMCLETGEPRKITSGEVFTV